MLNRTGSARVVYRAQLEEYNNNRAAKESEKEKIQGELDNLDKEIKSLSVGLE